MATPRLNKAIAALAEDRHVFAAFSAEGTACPEILEQRKLFEFAMCTTRCANVI